MSTTASASASARLEINVCCEECNYPFRYHHSMCVSESGGASCPTLAAKVQEELLNQLAAAISGNDLNHIGYHRCPHCGLLQSWMRIAEDEKRESKWMGKILLSALILSFLVGHFLLEVDIVRYIYDSHVLIAFSIMIGMFCACIYALQMLFPRRARLSIAQREARLNSKPLEIHLLGEPTVSCEEREYY